MKSTLLCMMLCSYSIVFPQSFPNNSIQNSEQQDSWEANALQYITRSDYFFTDFSSGYYGTNPKQQLNFNTTGLRMESSPMDGKKFKRSSLHLITIKNKALDANLSAKSIVARENYVMFNYPGFSVEYINDSDGLRQNFLLHQKPDGEGALKLSLKIDGDLQPVLNDRNELDLLEPNTGAVVLHYDGLKVWDKNNTALPAKMKLQKNGELEIWVDDRSAVYPVIVDPLTHVPEWETSADGVLPGLLTDLQLQIDAIHGYTVAGVGDVNNDGYDDVAIGAPAAIDVIAGPATIVGAGAVFLYFGSANGLPTTPSRVLRATTPVANALFGYSIAAGNISGSSTPGSIHSDIIVGAPLDAYTASVGGIPNTASVTAGKVYVFDGDQLTAGPASPLLNVYLNGSGVFNQLANVTVKALFGLSVAATEDMNGDGLGELVVGAPAYKGATVLSINSGAAFVYYSSNLVSNNPVILQPPSLVGFPDLINLGGLLYGWSVDGVGDYNQDGQPDIVVGAPGGLNLVGLGLLGGTAYVYSGTGAGVNTSISTRLSPTGTVIGTVANLFGFCVKGARDASGNRTGNILVGAPLGNVLSDILGGLRLKTGSIYMFASKPGATINEVATQSLSSPRGPNLLAQLLSVNIDVSALFGASLDNMRDVNCDGIGDIIVGEPLSTGVGLVAVDAVGGGASIFLGNADGTYQTVPYWSIENSVSYNAGVNAGSLLGYSVAGAGKTHGPLRGVRALVGAPGKALDFGTGVLNLGNTVGTLFSFAAGDNGLGKAYAFAFGCSMEVHPDVSVTIINQSITGNVQTNDNVIPGSVYGTPVPYAGNPAGATLSMNADGTYSFVATTPGIYNYTVPICTPEDGCVESHLQVTVLDEASTTNLPSVNTDIATTSGVTPVVIQSLINDAPGSVNADLDPASVSILVSPANGVATVDPVTGNINYTANPDFFGNDTLTYQVCDLSTPTALCNSAQQIITVVAPGAPNSVLAADDFIYFPMNTVGTGNVLTNDSDPENDNMTITPINTVIAGKGTIQINADGSFSFTPETGYSGPVEVVYTVCDDADPQACASATLYLLIANSSVVPVELISFEVQKQQCDAVLVWTTANETNFKNFVVELSTDGGIHFIPIGTVVSNGSRSGYSFRYAMTNSQSHLFRLKMLDIDSRIEYSHVQLLGGCNGRMQSIFVYPSPVVDVLQVEVRQPHMMNTVLRVFDLTGKEVSRTRISQANTALEVRNLLPGIYIIKLQDGTTLKFVKQ